MNIYEVKDLGTLNGDRPDARAINNAGVVVGRIGNHAMRYDGSLKILPTPLVASPAGQPATEKYVAWGINNSNPELIVGYREVNNYRYATMWVDGAYVDLHASLDANFSEAYDVNDNGVVVGRADFQAFRFDTNAGPEQPKFVQLLTADNVSSCAKAVNAQGHVVGWLDTYQNGFPISVAFIYDNGLSVLPDTYGESLRVLHDDLLDINDGNIVVGRIVPSDGAFQYDHNTKATTNITPEIPYPNQIHAAAQANNKYNRVVGKKWGGGEGLEVLGLCPLKVAHPEVLGAELPLCPGDALSRLARRPAGVDGLPQVGDGALGIAAKTLQARQAGQGIQALVEAHHRLERSCRLLVLAQFQERVAQHAVGVAITRIELDGASRQRGSFPELVAGGEDVSQMSRGPGVPRRELQRLAERLFRQRDVAQVASLPGLLDVGVTQPEIGRRAPRLAVELALTEPDRLIGGRGLRGGPGRVDHAQDREDNEDRDARALHGQGTSGPHGLAPGPLSPQST